MLQRFRRDGVDLQYYDSGGGGAPLVFQHGLTGDYKQPLFSFKNREVRLIILECRGHGGSEPGPDENLRIADFAGDLFALLRHLKLGKACFAGISMGAAVVANLAGLHPEMVSGLALIRPSWHDRPYPVNMSPFAAAADFLDLFGPGEGKRRFAAADSFAALERESPDNAASILAIFERRDPRGTVRLLRRLLVCEPGLDLAALARLPAPVRIMGTGMDSVHPAALAMRLAQALPRAAYVELYPKSLDKERHCGELTAAISALL